MKNEQHQQDIIKSHGEGFGGTDAKMFAKIGRDGVEYLNITEIRRILAVLGRCELPAFAGNVYTEAGHQFEDYMEGNMKQGYEREHLMESDDIKPKNFRIFAHADYYWKDGATVSECKYSQQDTEKVVETYYYQLQWYYMLGASKVNLVHGLGSVFPFEVEDYMEVVIERDPQTIEEMAYGIRVLDQAITDGYFDGIDPSETNVMAMGEAEEKAAAVIAEATRAIKEQERRIDEARAVMLEAMERADLLTIKGDGFTISYVAPSTRRTFDTKKAQAAHPDLKGDEYYKTSDVKASIRIKLEDKQ